MLNSSESINETIPPKDLKISLYLVDGQKSHFIGQLRYIGDIYVLVTIILKVLNGIQTKSFIKLSVEIERGKEISNRILYRFSDSDLFHIDRRHVSAILFDFYETVSENSEMNEEISKQLYYIIKEYLTESGLVSDVTNKSECLYITSLLLKGKTNASFTKVDTSHSLNMFDVMSNDNKSIIERITEKQLSPSGPTTESKEEVTKILTSSKIVPLFNIISKRLFSKMDKLREGINKGLFNTIYDSSSLFDNRNYQYNGEKLFKSARFQYNIMDSHPKIICFPNTNKYREIKTIIPAHHCLITKKHKSIIGNSIYFEDNHRYPLIIKKVDNRSGMHPLMVEDYIEIQALLINTSKEPTSLYGIVCYATMREDAPFQIYLVSKLVNFKKNVHRILNVMGSLNGLSESTHVASIEKKIKKMANDIKLHNKVLLFQ